RNLVPGLLATGSSRPPRRLVRREIGPLLGVAGFLGVRRAARVDPDSRKAALGDAQRQCSFLIVTAPDRQRAAGWDFFDQSFAQELADHLVGSAAARWSTSRLSRPPRSTTSSSRASSRPAAASMPRDPASA